MGLLRHARDFFVLTWRRGDAKKTASVVRADECLQRTGPMRIARTTYQNRRRALYAVAGITACGVCVGVGLVSPRASANLGTLIAVSLGDGEHQRNSRNEPHLYIHSRGLSERSMDRRLRSESVTSSSTFLSLQSDHRESHRDAIEGGPPDESNEETPGEPSNKGPGASSPRIPTSLQEWLEIESARDPPDDLVETSEARLVSRSLLSLNLTVEVAEDETGDIPKDHARNATPRDSCSSLQVEGLGRCPELGDELLQEMLQAKKEMLRQVVDVLRDPASCGAGGERDEPLLLVRKLAVDEVDAAFGAFEPRFLHFATDAAGWSPEPGGFNRWVELYYREILRKLRPVLVSVHGDDVCAIENELSLEARKAAALKDGMSQEDLERHSSYESEDFTVPVVLMTLGWDPSGDPTHRQDDHGRDRSCVYRVLRMPRVVRWFTSHTRYDSHTDVKFRYLPVGFGGYETRNGLPQKAYLEEVKYQLRVMETCPVKDSGRFDLLFQCNTLDRIPRDTIWKEMTEKETGPIPINRAPLPAAEMVAATTKGIFSVSPPGTGPDCFRNYEMLLGGNIVMVHDTYSLNRIMENLPVFFFGKHEDTGWGTLTCDKLKEMFRSVQAMIQAGKDGGGQGLAFEKLTHGFWRKYIRDETLKAGGFEPDMTYPERSIAPLNHPGWQSFRKLGCFSRSEMSKIPHSRQFVLKEGERNPMGCATKCSKKNGGVGFFGIQGGDLCWCDKEPGAGVTAKHCTIPCEGDSEHFHSCGGKDTSTAYVFGPEKRQPFEYLGCFKNSAGRVMYHVEVKLRGSNTPYVCEALCTSLRLPFFALENGHTCFCGVMPRDSPRSVRTPAFMPGAEGGFKGYDPPDAAFAGRPLPQGVRVGDPRFMCHKGRCSGDSSMWGCGSMSAYDLYRIVDPCVLYRDC